MRDRVVAGVRVAVEAVTLALVCLSPWAFASVHPIFESLLLSGVALLTILWAIQALIQRQVRLRLCPVAACLGGILLLGLWQITSMPVAVVGLLSAETVELNEQLLPTQRESLATGEPYERVKMAAGSTISLCPGVTRREVVRILAVVLLFLVVRSNITSRHAIRRFSIAVLVNGTLLAYFALVQFFSSDASVLYWTYPSLGTAFGPFINRNHFAFYENICVGLSLGLLLSMRSKEGRPGRAADGTSRTDISLGRHPNRRDRSHRNGWRHESHVAAARRRWMSILYDPRMLWIVASLAVMMSGVVMCCSRGGILALIAGAAACLLIRRTRSSRLRRLDAILLTVALALALLTWLGFDLLESRYATLWTGQALQDNRLGVWSHALRLVQDFPIFGTGYGTFPHVEPLYRPTADGADMFWDYAHNDYLQGLVEGGVLRLVLTVVAIGLVYRSAVRAYARYERCSTGGLVMGATFAFTTVVVHASVEFGLQMPAVACLATVLCAHLCALPDTNSSAIGRPGARGKQRLASGNPYRLHLGGLGRVLVAATAVLLALVVHVEGRRADLAERFRLAGLRAAKDRDPTRQFADLQAAVEMAPENAALYVELAQAHFGAMTGPERRTEAKERHLVEAQRRHLQARDLCPLLPRPQMWLAANSATLPVADAPEDYLNRALRLRPFDPQLWYVRGLRAISRGATDDALRSWRRSLDLSPRFLPDILQTCRQMLGPDAILEKLLPDDPGLLRQAGLQLYPDAEEESVRCVFFARALYLLQVRDEPLTSADHYLKAQLHRALHQPGEAREAYREALRRDGRKVSWRYEYAQLLREQGRLSEARRELRTLLRQQPNHARAGRMLTEVVQEMVRTREDGGRRPEGGER